MGLGLRKPGNGEELGKIFQHTLVGFLSCGMLRPLPAVLISYYVLRVS